jgi:23S rRNA pseudouridine1911/1915/1917 synthase
VTERRVTFGSEAAGERLDKVIAAELGELSRTQVQRLIDDGFVRVDGQLAHKANQRLDGPASVEVRIPPPGPASHQAESIPLNILFENDDLLVIDKPAGMVVHPAAGHDRGTLVNALLHHVKDLSGVGGVLRPGIVHRLDRGTSGLIVVAKDDATHQDLVRQFASRTVEKEYLAVVVGQPRRRAGAVDAPIGRDPVHRKRMSVRAPRGRPARSAYVVEESLGGAALLRVRIHTGRTHQIRVHLASIGHPIAGDATYGGKRAATRAGERLTRAVAALDRPALHATRLSFTHPATGERVAFESPLPDDLRALVERLRVR